MSKDKAGGVALGQTEAVTAALNAQDDSKASARRQLFDVMSQDKGIESAEDTAEESADTPITTENTSEQDVEPVEKTEELEEVEESEEETPEEEAAEESIDAYKEALEQEVARRERAEKKILKLKKEPKEEPSEVTAPVADANDVIEAARMLLREELLSSREEEVGEILEETLDSLTNNASERELIEYHYNNTINKSGVTKKSIQSDLENAKLLANKAQLMGENRELKAALVSKSTTSHAPEFSGRRLEEKRGPKLSGADKTLLKKFGLTEKSLAKKSK